MRFPLCREDIWRKQDPNKPIVCKRRTAMSFCDDSIYKFVTSKYYDVLEKLSPVDRASEIFRLQIEHLSYELKQTDEIFGWFVFDNREEYLPKAFSDTVPDDNTRKIIEAPLLHGSRLFTEKKPAFLRWWKKDFQDSLLPLLRQPFITAIY